MDTAPGAQALHAQDLQSTRGKLRRLILCLDGTWNTDDGQDITNIVRIRDVIEPKYVEGGEVFAQRVYYGRGVGTGLTERDKFIGGGTGAGLEENVREAYRFLSQYYEPGVEIYIFGFSRGAFTARSLAGYIGAGGLLRPEYCTRQNEQRTWTLYRTPPGDRFPFDIRELQKLAYPDVRIKCLGVFDTVGARGIPGELFQRGNRRRYGFHDVTLGANVDHAFHALAIDEMRGPFGASVWQYPNHKSNITAEQVWFPGVHANVGGGYPKTGISDLSLAWMLSRIETKKIGLRLLPGWNASLAPDALDEIYESRSRLYAWSRLSPNFRVINQTPPSFSGMHRLSSLAPHAVPVGESLHWSALYRWTMSLAGSNVVPNYAPPNLVAAVDAMLGAEKPKRLPVIDETGEPLNWYNDDEARDKLARGCRPSMATRCGA